MTDLSTQLNLCRQTWLDTLKHFKQERKLLPNESLQLGQAIQRYGVEAVELALLGIRFEKGSKDYDPSQHVYLARILRPDRFERFVGLGAQEINRRAAEAEEKQLEWVRALAHTDIAVAAEDATEQREKVASLLGRWSKRNV
jgi:hypothetical protein